MPNSMKVTIDSPANAAAIGLQGLKNKQSTKIQKEKETEHANDDKTV